MRRLRLLRLQAATSVGLLLAGSAPAMAQDLLAPAPTLRNGTQDDFGLPQLGAPALPPGLQRPTPGTRPSPDNPLFSVRPGFGAGRTGFDSTNARRRQPRFPSGMLLPRNPAALPEPAPAPVITGSVAAPVEATLVRKKRVPPPTSNTAYIPRSGPPAETAPASPPLDLRPPIGPTELTNPPPTITPAIRHPVPPEEDPFVPTGVRVGSFVLLPAVEATGGFDTNANRVQGGGGSAFWTIAPELTARSQWSRHELTATLRGSYSVYDQNPTLNRPQFDGRVDGRIDVTRNTQINVEARTILSTDFAGSPDLTAGFARLPIYTDVGATLGVTHKINRLEFSLKGTFDRYDYQNTDLIGGGTSSNADRNYNQYGAIARVSYELTPGIKPFVEGAFDQRDHDLLLDRNGLERDSDGWSVKAGSTFEFTRTITGELAIGHLTRTYRDPTLPDLQGLTVDGSLVWQATGLTTVKLSAATRGDESTLGGVSGVLRRDFGIQVDHALRRWLIASLRFGYGNDDYQGSVAPNRVDDRYLASFALTYKLSREWQLRGELRREWLNSNVPGASYLANVALLGLRWQR